ncbi:MAG: ABC transporter ATP-binding protein [SAR324 cluster bacterium]|nr:ABC transporter ATP-binding protein [SAR324 cluster bacterium]
MINIQNISKKFTRHVVLDHVNLEIMQGDRIALIGLNGAGKTTLIRTILGQYNHEGILSVAGGEPRKDRVEILQHVGFVPQHSPPIQMSVQELIKFSGKLNKNSDASAICEIVDDLGFNADDHKKKPFLKLSGGMKQKLLIAMALAKKPSVLIMDEPAANLDPAGRKAFFLRLSKIHRETTMILSSHRVDELLALINRIIEMDHGKIVLDERTGIHSLAGHLVFCKLKIMDMTDPIKKMMEDWNFQKNSEDCCYEGQIMDVDRLRFLNAISHFANHICELNIR